MKQKKSKILLIILTIIIFAFLTGAAFVCPHKDIYFTNVSDAGCVAPGQENVMCKRCDAVLEVHLIPATGHNWGDFVITKMPTKNCNGVQMRICYKCQNIEEIEYVCKHLETENYTAREPDCIEEGLREWKCLYCNTIVKQESIQKTDCSFSDWVATQVATPLEAGMQVRTCYICEKEEQQTYTMSMAGNNAIYIPESGINHIVTISSFTQWAVDSFDIVYTESAMQNGSNNPFVLGHNTGTLGALPNTRIGQYIYLSINGNIEVYQVKVSEAAHMANYGQDIIGNITGASLWDTYSGKTLHMYTCYGSGRWLVLAQKV